MEKQTQVLDASVIIKWFCEEENSSKARKIGEKYLSGEVELIAPELLFIEVINVLKCKKFDEEKLSEVNNFLWGVDFKIEKTSQKLMTASISLAKKHNLTIYDAIYLATAQLNSAHLISADSELVKLPNVISLNSL